MTTQEFITDLYDYYNGYNEVQIKVIKKWVESKHFTDAHLQQLFDAITINYSRDYRQSPDLAIINRIHKTVEYS